MLVDETSSLNGLVFVHRSAQAFFSLAVGRVRPSGPLWEFIDLFVLPILTQLVSDFADITLAWRASCVLLQPGDQAEIIEIVMLARLCFALLDEAVKTKLRSI